MHPLHGVSRGDGADPQGDRRLAAPAQRRLRLLLPDGPAHLHAARRCAVQQRRLFNVWNVTPAVLVAPASKLHSNVINDFKRRVFLPLQ